jgi:CubicO group peptidase (beta-lactamase class C family)
MDATLLPRSTPEAQGLSSAALLGFVDAIDTDLDRVHSVMLVRHGHVVAEGWWHPYAADLPHSLFSVSKSVTSMAVGFAIAERRLSLGDQVVSLLPDSAPAVVSDNLAAMTVRHLLTMTTGHATDTVGEFDGSDDDWTRALLALPVQLEPGTAFVYNTGATFLLSAIVQRLTGERLLDYLTPRLFEPLGIEGATWEQSPLGIDVGGWGLSLTTEQIAVFGQTLLQGGAWRGRQVVPADWISEATGLRVRNGDFEPGNDGTHGYGYQFWRSQHAAYRADGAFGQLCIVFPEHDAVLVLTAGLDDMQREMNVVWRHLLPALETSDGQADDAASAALTGRLATLAIEPPPGDVSSPEHPAGSANQFPPNRLGVAAMDLSSGEGANLLSITDTFGSHEIALGHGRWAGGTAALFDGERRRVAAAGAWQTPRRFVAVVVSVETPFSVTITLDHGERGVRATVQQNVWFDETLLLDVTLVRPERE